MNRWEAKKRVYDGLTEAAGLGGFRLNRSAEGFVRKIPGGTQQLSVPFWDYCPEFQFSLVRCIRLDAVEDLFHRFSGSPERFHKETLTSMTQLEYFGEEPTPGRGVIFKAVTEAEFANELSRLSAFIRKKALPFFDRYNTLEALDRAMNPEIPPPARNAAWDSNRFAFDSTSHPYRGMRAVIIAHLVGNPRFEELLARYTEEMHDFIPVEREKFDKLVDYLTTKGFMGD